MYLFIVEHTNRTDSKSCRSATTDYPLPLHSKNNRQLVLRVVTRLQGTCIGQHIKYFSVTVIEVPKFECTIITYG